jgi:hypothetical protein
MNREVKKGPQCERIKRYPTGRTRCRHEGVHCWVVGEFGRQNNVLCQNCILDLRAVGWTVRYQLEGDNPQAVSSGQTSL